MAEDFTFANVRLAAAGMAYALLKRSEHPRVVIGYDTRFLSEKFAETAARILASHGIEVRLTSRPHPTPALACQIIREGLDGGVNVTASHNPPEYNGLKFSSSDGAPALSALTLDIEESIGSVTAGERPLQGSNDATPFLQASDPRPAYLEDIRRKIDLDAIRRAGLKIAFDPLFGTARGYADDLLREAGLRPIVLHDWRDALFSGAGPEPSAQNLGELARTVKDEKCAVGISTDGDADRFGVVDADGTWIHPNYVLGLLADYLIDVRKIPGGLGRSVATTHLLDAIARHYGVPLYQTPVGFKYIGELIKAGKVAMGGEESAGLTIRAHVPEKDGILAALLVVEAVARRGLSVGEQLRALFKKVGPYYSERVNLRLERGTQERLMKKLQADWSTFDSRRVRSIDRTDGLKMICEDGSWVLMRSSGTEPVVRVYGEAPSRRELEELMKAAKQFALNS